MDPAVIGKQIKQYYPQYANVDDAAIGQRYIQKYGASVQAVTSGQLKTTDLPAKEQVGATIGLNAAGYKPAEKVNAPEQKNQDAFAAANALVDTLEKRAQEAGVGEYSGFGARISGTEKGFLGFLGLDDKAKTYKDLRSGFIAGLKGITGDTGVLTEQDAKRLAGLIPSLSATPGEAQAKFEDLRKQIAEKFNQKSNPSDYKAPDSKGGALAAVFPNIANAWHETQKMTPEQRHQVQTGQDLATPEGQARAWKTTSQVAPEVFGAVEGANSIANLLTRGASVSGFNPIARAGEKRVLAGAEAEGAGKVFHPQQVADLMAQKIEADTTISKPVKDKLLQRVTQFASEEKPISIQQSIGDFSKADAFTKGGTRIKGVEGRYAGYLRDAYKDLWAKEAPDVLKHTQELAQLFKYKRGAKNALMATSMTAGGVAATAYLYHLLTGQSNQNGQ